MIDEKMLLAALESIREGANGLASLVGSLIDACNAVGAAVSGAAAIEWNAAHPVGVLVAMKDDFGHEWLTHTRSAAWSSDWSTGPSHAIIMVMGKTGGYSLDRIRAVSNEEGQWISKLRPSTAVATAETFPLSAGPDMDRG